MEHQSRREAESEMTREEANQAWERVDAVLQNHGVYFGVPLTPEANNNQLVGKVRDDIFSVDMQPNGNNFLEFAKKTLAKHGATYKNHWKLRRPYRGFKHGTVIIYEEDGKSRAFILPSRNPDFLRANMFLETGATRLEGNLLPAELKARKKLREMVSETQWACYELNDAFVEVGQSGMAYFIRKSRPTLALRRDELKFLCALCLHPMAYYEGTWTGALTPTDEMIAHLVFIRGDEYGFWKKANHISLDRPESGI